MDTSKPNGTSALDPENELTGATLRRQAMSIADVAKSVGVSTSTVSRVINRAAGVTPEVARAVVDAMERMGYQPPVRRRGRKPLARRGIETGNIALAAIGLEPASLYRMPVFSTLMQSIEAALREHGLSLLLASLPANGSIPPALSRNQVDGMFLIGTGSGVLPAPLWERIAGIPTVGLLRGFDQLRTKVDRVIYDNSGIGPLAAEYLLNLGHRRAASFNSQPTHPMFFPRQTDFASAMTAGGGEVLTLTSPHDAQELRQQLSEYKSFVAKCLEVSEPPTAIFIPTSAQVPMLYEAMEERGLHAGRDVEVITCDTERQVLSKLTPRPATIGIGVEEIARRGVQQLLWRMGHPDEPPFTTLVIEPVLWTPEEVLSPPVLSSPVDSFQNN